MIRPDQFNYYSTYLLVNEAEKRGIKVNKPFTKGVFARRSLVTLQYRKHKEVIVGQRTSQTSVVAFWIQQNKHVAKYFLENAGIKTAVGEVFNVNDKKALHIFVRKTGFPLIVKQLSGTHGSLVFLGVSSIKEVDQTIQKISQQGKSQVLIEKEFKGKEYRLMATKDKFLAATYRMPANVVSDGEKNIRQLIRQKNSDPRRGKGHRKSLVKIKVDSMVKDYLKSQHLSLASVPPKNKQIFLRPNSNLSTGGDSIDVTDDIHPAVKKLAVKSIKAIPGLAYGGIDYMTTDITKKPNSRNYIIIEINDSPMLSMHHIPYEGKSRDVAKEIIDGLFPETKK